MGGVLHLHPTSESFRHFQRALPAEVVQHTSLSILSREGPSITSGFERMSLLSIYQAKVEEQVASNRWREAMDRWQSVIKSAAHDTQQR